MNSEHLDDNAAYLRPTRMSAEERRQKRSKKKNATASSQPERNAVPGGGAIGAAQFSDDKFADLLKRNEDDLLEFVAKVNHVYQEKLKKDAPFITFMFCGMQSAGKSTIMERFMNAVLNIVQEGTGTRCPLDTTCIHDEHCVEPICSLYGNELNNPGANLKVNQVFDRITSHNRKLSDEDRFSTEPLRLVYKASNVQNMRFVDTPGIISTKGLGNDNREDIKRILRAEMCKANTKLCVLLEPKEFATNDIINFCDETFGDREKWMPEATFLMTKFDKQLEDARTGSKANHFFNMFHECGCFPHLVITPTLPKEDLPPAELYEARLELLLSADKVESERFLSWRQGHDQYRQQDPSDSVLSSEVADRIGFKSAKTVMREIMLQDTVKRLPEVIAELRKELSSLTKEKKTLDEKMKFNDPAELKSIVAIILYDIETRINSYLDGDLESAMNFPSTLQTLDDEIDEEENSEWAEKELNHHTAEEDVWRDLIARYEGDYPESVHPTRALFGGKQVQRAIDFFKMVMIEALPDPYELKKIVVNATGFLGGCLQRENWERATVQVVRVSVKKVSHPGINFLIKHIGYIFRRLFTVALDDVKQGEEMSSTFQLLPSAVEKHFLKEFDDLLWKLMVQAAMQTHNSMEPMVRLSISKLSIVSS
jgi:Dynamin family